MRKQETLKKEATRIYDVALRCDGKLLCDYYKNYSSVKENAYDDCMSRIPLTETALDTLLHGVGSANSWSFTFYATYNVKAVVCGVKTVLTVHRYESSSKLETIIYDCVFDKWYDVYCENGGMKYTSKDRNENRSWDVIRG